MSPRRGRTDSTTSCSPSWRVRPSTDAEIVELGFAAGGFLMWGRLHRAFDVPPSGPGYHAMLANERGGIADPS